MDLFDKIRTSPQLAARDAALENDYYPFFHEISSRQQAEVIMDGKRTIMLGSNNYLGLTSDDRVISAAENALRTFGSGCSGSRYLNGTITLHNELERELAAFFGYEDSVTFSTGFQSNLGIISALCGRHDMIFFDRLNHASLYDAARLSFAKLIKYDHNNMEELEDRLKDANPDRGKLIVVDGVFSMEGDLADLPAIVELAEKYGARIMVDDSHGVGTMGAGGRGVTEHFGLTDKTDILMGTFSKSLASLGGFMAASREVCEFVRHTSRPFIFSASIPPANAAAALCAIRLLKEHPEMVKQVNDNADYMRAGFRRLGIRIGDSQAPIIPVLIGDDLTTLLANRDLLRAGVFVNPVIPPAVEDGNALLRTSYTATMTREQLDVALDGFQRVFKNMKLI
jgi:8-amino-7-oxononanoate synthase